MPDVGSLTFDLTDCVLREQSETHRGWMNPAGVGHVLRFHRGAPDWPFDLTDPAGAAAYFRRASAANGGVLLEMEVVAAAGTEALRGLFKYRSPVPDSLGMYYVGIVWLPFRDCVFQVNVEAMEAGTTGFREAAVMVLLGDEWPKPPQEQIPLIETEEQLQALYRSAPARQLPSDDAKYDPSFPDHPLSLVRARLAQVIATLRLESAGRALKPFRLRRGWWFGR